MIAFDQYRCHLLDLANRLLKEQRWPSSARELSAALNGQPGWVLRTVVEPEARRLSGAYFTGSHLAKKLLTPWAKSIKTDHVKLFDPACGAGDLLLAAARYLPVRKTLQETINFWGECLSGYDIHKTFVRTAKVRLILLAIERGVTCDKLPNSDETFPGILCGDYFQSSPTKGITHIVMNPPFTLIPAPNDCKWGQGLVNEAAIFLEKTLKTAELRTEFAAILPDVLRTGSRYRRWRETISDMGVMGKITIAGHFGTADVDVFTLYMKKSQQANINQTSWWDSRAGKTIGDLFDVNVGPVVPHRDPKSGIRAPFFDTGSANTWSILHQPVKWRKYSGRLFKSPLVVIRRTSSPSDRNRACASVINISTEAAIENHLLVLTPKDGRLATCTRLMQWLRRDDASRWLNKRIRCRHLTVGSIATLPFEKEPS